MEDGAKQIALTLGLREIAIFVVGGTLEAAVWPQMEEIPHWLRNVHILIAAPLLLSLLVRTGFTWFKWVQGLLVLAYLATIGYILSYSVDLQNWLAVHYRTLLLWLMIVASALIVGFLLGRRVRPRNETDEEPRNGLPGSAAVPILSAADLALLASAPAIRIDYISGTIAKLVLKNDRDSPAIIRQVGKLISREEYGSDYTVNLTPSVPPQVEKGNPVECKIYGLSSPRANVTSLENVLRTGSSDSLDYIVIDYDDCDGNQFSRLFLLTRNSDGSIVFVPDPIALRGRTNIPAPKPQSLFSLRHQLAVSKYLQRTARQLPPANEGVLSDADKIKITLPKHAETLIDKQPLGPNSFSYIVRGTLKSLPDGHMIWLLTADDQTEQYWPQGFQSVQYNQQTGEWQGRVHVGRSPLRIVALVAPPTSQQLFRYFQSRGDETKVYSPLDRIPEECDNIATVQTRIP
jgi:hypothetical protein